MEQLDRVLSAFPLVINTVPSLLLDEKRLNRLAPKALVLDLASKPGGDDVGDTDVRGRAMDKEKLYWIIGLMAVAAVSLIHLYLQAPRQPVILTYQSAEPVITEAAAAEMTAAESTQTQTETESAPAQTYTETAESCTTAPPAPNRNLNTATAEELMRVEGIGAVLAAEIIAYRTKCGGFIRSTQLTEINGIGAVLAARILSEFEIPDAQPEPEVIAPAALDADSVPDAEQPQPAGPFDVNTVTREELLTIPGMDETLADAILATRERLDCYHGIYEVMYAEPDGVYFEDVLRDWLYVADDPLSRQPND